jgi:hypothetical protein
LFCLNTATTLTTYLYLHNKSPGQSILFTSQYASSLSLLFTILHLVDPIFYFTSTSLHNTSLPNIFLRKLAFHLTSQYFTSSIYFLHYAKCCFTDSISLHFAKYLFTTSLHFIIVYFTLPVHFLFTSRNAVSLILFLFTSQNAVSPATFLLYLLHNIYLHQFTSSINFSSLQNISLGNSLSHHFAKCWFTNSIYLLFTSNYIYSLI